MRKLTAFLLFVPLSFFLIIKYVLFITYKIRLVDEQGCPRFLYLLYYAASYGAWIRVSMDGLFGLQWYIVVPFFSIQLGPWFVYLCSFSV